MKERDFFLRWIAEARRSMTREAHEDGRTEGEIIDDLGNVLANFGADSFTDDPEQVAEHDRLLALPRTYSLPPSAPAADAGIVARYTATVTDICEPDEATSFPSVVICAGKLHGEEHECAPPTFHSVPAWEGVREGDVVEVLVRVLDAEHAARRGG